MAWHGMVWHGMARGAARGSHRARGSQRLVPYHAIPYHAMPYHTSIIPQTVLALRGSYLFSIEYILCPANPRWRRPPLAPAAAAAE